MSDRASYSVPPVDPEQIHRLKDSVTNQRNHIPALDGIRGVAVLIVMFHHCASFVQPTGRVRDSVLLLSHVGWTGVNLFFVLSGFLITGILLETKAAANRAQVFYARRALRIFPIYYLTLGTVLLTANYSDWLQQLLPFRSRADITAFLLYFQNWIPFWHGGHFAPNIIGHFWSLGVEEEFYFLWPWLIWTLPARFHLRICIIGVLASFLLRVAVVAIYGPAFWMYLMTSVGIDCLLTGSALAVVAFESGRVPRAALLAMAGIGLGIVLALALYDIRNFGRPDVPFTYTIGIVGFALLFGSLVGSAQYPDWHSTKALSVNWLRRVGAYSYGIYVYHVPLLLLEYHLIFDRLHVDRRQRNEFAFVIGVAISSYLVAWVSYRWLESPILNQKRRFRPVYRKPESIEQFV